MNAIITSCSIALYDGSLGKEFVRTNKISWTVPAGVARVVRLLEISIHEITHVVALVNELSYGFAI